MLKFGKLGAQGQDLDIAGEGKIALRDSFSDSLADLYLRFRFSDAYKGKNDMTKSLFGAPGSAMPALFELADPRIKNSKRTDGFYGWHMAGAMKDPRFEPAASYSGSGRGGAYPGRSRTGRTSLTEQRSAAVVAITRTNPYDLHAQSVRAARPVREAA